MRSAPPPFHEFAEPNVHAPFAVREMIAAAPADIGVRGVYFNFIGDELARIGHSEPQRIAFKWYPLRELMELEVRAASLLHPHVPVREGLRRVARISYTSLVSTTVGRVLFSVAGLDFRVALTLTSKAYALSMNRGTCEMLELHKGWARAALRDIHNFVDSSQVGVFEGAMEAYGVEGRVLVRPIDQANADFLIEWT